MQSSRIHHAATSQNREMLHKQEKEQTGSASLWQHSCYVHFTSLVYLWGNTFYWQEIIVLHSMVAKAYLCKMCHTYSQTICSSWMPRSLSYFKLEKTRKQKNYLTVGAVMIPMKRILPQLKGWLAWNTKICFKKNVFNSVS